MKELEKILDLMRRIDETFVPATLFEAALERSPLFIEEGLIKSYPVDRVAKSISTLFNLDYDGNDRPLEKLRGNDKPNGTLHISKPNDDDEIIIVKLDNPEIRSRMDSHFLKYGWFNSRIDDNKYFYERRFGDRFTVGQLLNITGNIYHITSSVLKKKIEKEGLIPKESKTYGYNNDERVYFSPEKPSIQDVRDFKALKGDNHSGIPYIVIEVDLKSLPESQSFFFDPRWRNSIFTFEPIAPTALTIIEEDDLPKFKLR